MPLALRAAALIAIVVMAAACGPEAPPRLGGPAPTRAAPLLGPTEPPAQAAAGNPRALGDPSAPIVVVEYSDYQ